MDISKQVSEMFDESLFDKHEMKGIENVLPFSALERIERLLVNSAAFDKASYEADGGDGWVDSRRAPIFEKPMGVDEALWAKAKAAGVAALGHENWKFTLWMYRKLGGKHA